MTFGVGSGGGSSMRVSSGSGDGTVERAMISAVEDTAVEGDHEFTVSIRSTSPPARVGLSSVVATIMDDDRKSTLKCELIIVSSVHVVLQSTVDNVMIGMEETNVSVHEDVINGTVSICAEIAALPGELQTNLTVTLFTTNGTKAGWYCSCSVSTFFPENLSQSYYVVAVLGEDFTEPSLLQVTFSSGDLVGDTACATFGIINDNNLESDHEFTVYIRSVIPSGPNISSPSTIVSVVDDDGMHCR